MKFFDDRMIDGEDGVFQRRNGRFRGKNGGVAKW
jgi:hypothetical protein